MNLWRKKTAVTAGIRRKEGERDGEREDCIVGISWRPFELPVNGLNAELSVAGSFNLPTGPGPPPLLLCLCP